MTVKSNESARRAADYATGRLISVARQFTGVGTGSTCAELLHAAREYARAMRRLETLRTRR